MHGFAMAARTRDRDEFRAQAFINEELHARRRSSKASVSEAFGIRKRRGFIRGRPRAG